MPGVMHAPVIRHLTLPTQGGGAPPDRHARPCVSLDRGAALGSGCLACIVLDEADLLLSLGFDDMMFTIVESLPPEVQVCLASAALAPQVLDLASKIMRDAVRIRVDKDELTLAGGGNNTDSTYAQLSLVDAARAKELVAQCASMRAQAEAAATAMKQLHGPRRGCRGIRIQLPQP